MKNSGGMAIFPLLAFMGTMMGNGLMKILGFFLKLQGEFLEENLKSTILNYLDYIVYLFIFLDFQEYMVLVDQCLIK